MTSEVSLTCLKGKQRADSPQQTLLPLSMQQGIFVDAHRRALFLRKGRLRSKVLAIEPDGELNPKNQHG